MTCSYCLTCTSYGRYTITSTCRIGIYGIAKVFIGAVAIAIGKCTSSSYRIGVCKAATTFYGISDIDDIDDDNDGIPDEIECGLTPVDFSPLSPTRPGFASTVFTEDINGSTLPVTVTLDAPTQLVGSDGLVELRADAPGEILRFQDFPPSDLNDGISTTMSFSAPWPIRFGADNLLGNSNINQQDAFTITPIGAAANFQWVIHSSANADISMSGNDLNIAGSATSGTGGLAPYAEFDISSNSPISGIQIVYENTVQSATSNSGRFIFAFCGDTDSDGLPDMLDLDADNDGIPDIVEAGGTDTDGDGLVDAINPDGTLVHDTDGDGLDDLYDADNTGTAIAYPDTDGDNIPDALDLDADNDGIPDVIESGGADADNDGIADNFADADMDGFNDTVDGDPNNDGTADNTANAQLPTGPDTDGDGAPNSYPEGNLDQDPFPNYIDLDADNDGIVDIIEAGGDDADGNGMVDGTSTASDPQADANRDGWADIIAGVGHPLPNTDNGDADHPDYLDIDADDDGITDNVEGQSTAGFDQAMNDDGTGGFVAPTGMDDDMDGIDNAYDNDPTNFGGSGIDSDVPLGSAIPPHDYDGDGTPDYIDLDSDGDGTSDRLEGHDTNQDGSADDDLPCTTSGAPDFTVTVADADGDGLLDCYDSAVPTPDVTQVGTGSSNCPDPTDTNCTPEDPTPGDNDAQPDFRDNNTDVLPLELLSFNALVTDCALHLDWQTIAEINVAYISIERSSDGTNYRSLHQMLATGNPNTPTSYSWEDPYPNYLNYYRLKVVDEDGSFDYSPVVTVTYDCYRNETLTALYPVPTENELTLDFHTQAEVLGKVKITDMLGRILLERNVVFDYGVSSQTIELRGLPAGTYVLSVEINGKEVDARRFVKIK